MTERREDGDGELVHVLVLATTVPVQSGDGTPSFVLDLAAALADQMRVTILAPRVSGSVAVTEIDGVTVIRFPFFIKRWEGLADEAIMPTLQEEPWRWLEVPFLFGSMAWHMWRLIKRGDFAVLNPHWIVPAGLVARMSGPLTGLPYVVTVHGADAYTLRGRIFGAVKRSVLRNASAILPVSHEIAVISAALVGSGEPVPMSVPMGVLRPSNIDVSRHAGTFLVVGRLAEKKGVDVAIRALAETPSARLIVIGDGPQMGALQALASDLQIEDRVEFCGRQPRSIVLSEMAACTGLLIPSIVAADGDTDGTPVVLAEALSLGTPVMASRIAGLSEFVVDGETGSLVEPGDVAAWANQLRSVRSDPEGFSRLGVQAAAEFVGGPLDLRSTAGTYAETLRKSIA